MDKVLLIIAQVLTAHPTRCSEGVALFHTLCRYDGVEWNQDDDVMTFIYGE